jgi:hypothetical protein
LLQTITQKRKLFKIFSALSSNTSPQPPLLLQIPIPSDKNWQVKEKALKNAKLKITRPDNWLFEVNLTEKTSELECIIILEAIVTTHIVWENFDPEFGKNLDLTHLPAKIQQKFTNVASMINERRDLYNKKNKEYNTLKHAEEESERLKRQLSAIGSYRDVKSLRKGYIQQLEANEAEIMAIKAKILFIDKKIETLNEIIRETAKMAE